MSSKTSNESKKRPSDKDDFESLRRYILRCPLFTDAEKNPAVIAALKGLDNGLKSIERDAKLQKKFAQSSSVEGPSSETAVISDPSFEFGDADEWQQVAADDSKRDSLQKGNRVRAQEEDDEVEIIDVERDSSFLGKQLSECSIASIAESRAKVRSPVAAIAIALHAAMRSDILGFDCTGVTDESNTKCNGFAAPVRALPKNTFLPKDWDKEALYSDSSKQSVTLRYRKAGTGAVLLKVDLVTSTTAEATKEVSVNLVPLSSQEPPSQPHIFPLDAHINMDSWASALKASNFGIQPALHYKNLPALLTSFAKTFDLGSVSDNQFDSTGQTSYVAATQTRRQSVHDNSSIASRSGHGPPIVGGPVRVYDERNPNIRTAFPSQKPSFVGDFSGDLGHDPLQILGSRGPSNLMPGNLMGPNHPMFHGGTGASIVGIGESSGFGMRPRFDPFGPPGGPQQVDIPNSNDSRPHPAQRKPPGGNPNPDHLQPPNSLGNTSMFS